MNYLFLLLGFITLLLSGNYLVKSSVSLARNLNVSTLVIGIVIVSFGTSAPELVISVKSAVEGHPDIAIGNVLGSNIANIALVLAITALIIRIPIKRNSLVIDWPVMMIASGLFILFSWDLKIVFYESLFFLVFLLVYIFLSFYNARRDAKKFEIERLNPEFNVFFSVLIFIISCIGLVYGANWLIKAVTNIAKDFGVSERIISLTVVAFGTSLPELATSVVAAVKKELDISVGNIIGSNIFNILAVIGVSGVITDLEVDKFTLFFDVWWMLAIAFGLFLLCLPLRKSFLNWWKGLFLLSAYFYYIYLLF